MANGVVNLNSNYSGGFGAGYISRPMEMPYSTTALALQSGKYPAIQYYGVQTDYNPYGMSYGRYC